MTECEDGGTDRPARPGRADAPSAPQGGLGIQEEMCVNYAHYYPRTELELCKSATDPGYLRKYFVTVNRWRLRAGLGGGGGPARDPRP